VSVARGSAKHLMRHFISRGHATCRSWGGCTSGCRLSVIMTGQLSRSRGVFPGIRGTSLHCPFFKLRRRLTFSAFPINSALRTLSRFILLLCKLLQFLRAFCSHFSCSFLSLITFFKQCQGAVMILMDSATPTLQRGRANCRGPMNVGSERNVSFLHLSNYGLTRRSPVPLCAQTVMKSVCMRPCFKQASVSPSFQWFENCSITWTWSPTRLPLTRGDTFTVAWCCGLLLWVRSAS
jgi:hypothetical protein